MLRFLARLLLVVLVLLSSGAMPVPMRAGKSRSCCAVKSSCDRMLTEASGNSCCRVLPASAHSNDAAPPSGACVIAVMGCGPAAATSPSAPIVFQFLVPAGPAYPLADAAPLARTAIEDASIDAERTLRPRPPRLALAPEHRA